MGGGQREVGLKGGVSVVSWWLRLGVGRSAPSFCYTSPVGVPRLPCPRCVVYILTLGVWLHSHPVGRWVSFLHWLALVWVFLPFSCCVHPKPPYVLTGVIGVWFGLLPLHLPERGGGGRERACRAEASPEKGEGKVPPRTPLCGGGLLGPASLSRCPSPP